MKILVFAPHPDDEVLGCGGIINKYSKKGDDVYVCIITKACAPIFDEATLKISRQENKKAASILGIKETIYLDFPAAMLETIDRHELNSKVLEVVNKIKPDEVYIPHRGDMQLDHKLTVDACMVALRPKYKHKVLRVYSYETLSETGWDIPTKDNAFVPNVYIDITANIDKKISAMKAYKSQLCEYPNARSIEAIKALSIYRGTTVGYKFAESFELIREIKK